MTNEQIVTAVTNIETAISQIEQLIKIVQDGLSTSKISLARLKQTVAASGIDTQLKTVLVGQRKADAVAILTQFTVTGNQALGMAPNMASAMTALIEALEGEE